MVEIMLIASCVICYASNNHSNTKFETMDVVELEFDLIIDEHTNNGGRPRTSPLFPQVCVEGHSLYITSGCANSKIKIIDINGCVIYSLFNQNDGVVVNLPSNIHGASVIQIVRGSFIFSADHFFDCI